MPTERRSPYAPATVIGSVWRIRPRAISAATTRAHTSALARIAGSTPSRSCGRTARKKFFQVNRRIRSSPCARARANRVEHKDRGMESKLPATGGTPSGQRRRRLVLGLAIVAALVAVVGYLLWDL